MTEPTRPGEADRKLGAPPRRHQDNDAAATAWPRRESPQERSAALTKAVETYLAALDASLGPLGHPMGQPHPP